MTRTGLEARIAVPPLAGFVLVAAYVLVEAFGFRALSRPEDDTVSEAAALGHAARALQLIAAGQDASVGHPVRAGLIDHEAHEFTPVEAAILGRHAEVVRLLQRSGARGPQSARTTCFARLRLPEVLKDLGASADGAGNGDADLETTLRTCAAEDTRL